LFFRPEDAGKLRESLRMGRQPKSAAASKADGKIDGKAEPPPPPPPVYNDITLSGLLYFGPASWTAWLNGVPMSRSMGDFYYEVRTATADYVDVWVSAPDPQLVRLRPHQTWRVAFGDVIERR
ncbi:MAG: hypothetical protein K2Q10_08395, partial [Rhodospirillales bacterium]|nr:hypothetical protein [Rhodospirillales bacterium]